METSVKWVILWVFKGWEIAFTPQFLNTEDRRTDRKTRAGSPEIAIQGKQWEHNDPDQLKSRVH